MKAKKVMALALAAVMLVVTSVAATIAYLTDDDVVVNTFTVGNVQIELHETDEQTRKDGTVGKDYHLQPGLTYDKDPTVTVLKDSEDCYVRVLVKVENIEQLKSAFPKTGVDYSDWNIKNWYGTDDVFLLQNLVNWNESAWQYKSYDANTATYEFWYTGEKAINGIVSKNEETPTKLESVFTQIIIPGEIDNTHLAYLQDAKITVTAHAIQAAGFDNATQAWGAWS